MTATLTAEEFNTLLRLAQAVDLIEARAQLEHSRAVAKRDAYYATLATIYGWPPTWAGLQWNDATREIAIVTPPSWS
jgi:hypothetical protein